MPRPQTIYVDRDRMLLGINQATVETIAELEQSCRARRAAGDPFYGKDGVELDEVRNFGGIRIDFPRFVGKFLTDSERLRHQQALRAMEAAGLVLLDGIKARRVKLTIAGLARLNELEAAGHV